jgi:hypothetical protein
MCVRGMDFASVLFLQLSDWFSELSLIYYYIIIIISIIIIVQTSNCNNNIFELYLHIVCYVLLCDRNGVSGWCQKRLKDICTCISFRFVCRLGVFVDLGVCVSYIYILLICRFLCFCKLSCSRLWFGEYGPICFLLRSIFSLICSQYFII